MKLSTKNQDSTNPTNVRNNEAIKNAVDAENKADLAAEFLAKRGEIATLEAKKKLFGDEATRLKRELGLTRKPKTLYTNDSGSIRAQVWESDDRTLPFLSWQEGRTFKNFAISDLLAIAGGARALGRALRSEHWDLDTTDESTLINVEAGYIGEQAIRSLCEQIANGLCEGYRAQLASEKAYKKAEAERLEAERLAAEKAEAERLEAERLAAEKAEQDRELNDARSKALNLRRLAASDPLKFQARYLKAQETLEELEALAALKE